ncbi:hypothetical protein KKHLCK_15040 [Candidatus Electrothrix laxa]
MTVVFRCRATVFKDRAAALIKEFEHTPRYIVADCKMYTRKNAPNLSKLLFVTRIPQNIKEVEEVITQALDNTDDWLEFDDGPNVKMFNVEHYGIRQRWHVVSSEASRQKSVKKIEKKAKKKELRSTHFSPASGSLSLRRRCNQSRREISQQMEDPQPIIV